MFVFDQPRINRRARNIFQNKYAVIFRGGMLGLLVLLFTVNCHPTEFFVTNTEEITNILNSTQPGDSIVMKDGVWSDQYVTFEGKGTRDAPIILRAQTPGGVTLTGSSHLDISGRWLIVDGLRFESGFLESGQHVVRFTGKSGDCVNCRFTNSRIVNFNPKSVRTHYFWISLFGNNNRVDNNRFEGQNHSGVTLTVWRKPNVEDHHVIEYNHFLNRSQGNGNGYETIRIGTSGEASSNSYSIVQFNLFERTNGEIEVISVKSGNNIIRSNTFRQVAGSVTLRHGNENRVTDNVFLGDGAERTAGIRVMGENHVISNNYLQDLKGVGISFNCGHTDNKLANNAPVKNIVVSNNTLINVETFAFRTNVGCGISNRIIRPVTVKIINNLVLGKNTYFLDGKYEEDWVISNNLYFGNQSIGWSKSFGIQDNPILEIDTNGLWKPSSSSPVIKYKLGNNYVESIENKTLNSNTNINQIPIINLSIKPLKASDVGPFWMK